MSQKASLIIDGRMYGTNYAFSLDIMPALYVYDFVSPALTYAMAVGSPGPMAMCMADLSLCVCSRSTILTYLFSPPPKTNS